MAYDPNKDYMAEINKLKAAGTPDNSEELRRLIAERTEKINGNSNLSQYANQQIGETYLNGQTKTGQGTGQTAYNRTVTAGASTNPMSTNGYPSQSNQGLIESQNAELINALKARLQQSMVSRKAQSQPLRDNSEVQKAQELRMVLEQSANSGDRGGIGRQNALETQTAGEGRLISINNQEAADIAAMQSDASIQEAQLRAQMYGDIREENRYQGEDSYRRLRDSITDKREDTRFDYQKEQDALGKTQYETEWAYKVEMDRLQREDAEREREWQRSEANPAYKNQLIQNEINSLQLANIPQQLKDEAALIKLQLEQGRIDLDTAKEQLRQLKIKPISSGGSSGGSGGNNKDYGLNW